MKKIIKRLKSNNGFTIQDVVIGLVILTMFAGLIGSIFVAIYKVQSETKLTASASLYGIQILENIDKISYEEVVEGKEMEDKFRQTFQIPEAMQLNLKVTPKNEEDTMKIVELTINYNFAGETETILFQKLKVKEL